MSLSALIPALETALKVDNVDNVYAKSPIASDASSSETNLFIDIIQSNSDDGREPDKSVDVLVSVLGFVGRTAPTQTPYTFLAGIWDALYDKLHKRPEELTIQSDTWKVTQLQVQSREIARGEDRNSTGLLVLYVRMDSNDTSYNFYGSARA